MDLRARSQARAPAESGQSLGRAARPGHLSLDDGPYFDGKPEDFTFKLAGEARCSRTSTNRRSRTGRRSARSSRDADLDAIDSSDVGWRLESPEFQLIPSECSASLKSRGEVRRLDGGRGARRVGADPVGVGAASGVDRRGGAEEPVLPVPASGSSADKETGRGYWKNKFDWKGTALVNYAVPQFPVTKVDGEPGYVRTSGGSSAGGYAVNYQAGPRHCDRHAGQCHQYYIDIPDAVFETERIVRSGSSGEARSPITLPGPREPWVASWSWMMPFAKLDDACRSAKVTGRSSGGADGTGCHGRNSRESGCDRGHRRPGARMTQAERRFRGWRCAARIGTICRRSPSRSAAPQIRSLAARCALASDHSADDRWSGRRLNAWQFRGITIVIDGARDGTSWAGREDHAQRADRARARRGE